MGIRIKNRKTLLSLLLLSFALVIIGYGGLTLRKDQSEKNAKAVIKHCNEIVNKADNDSDSLDKKAAIRIIKDNEKACTKSQDKVTQFKIYSRLAPITYDSGDKAKAKSYADSALKIANRLSFGKQNKIYNFNVIVLNLKDISAGKYYSYGSID
jgi:hypothetical protein